MEDISDHFEIFSDSRNIYSGTGRFEMWEYVIKEIILMNPVSGIGGSTYADHMQSVFGVSGCHNIILDQIARFGLVGAFLFFSLVYLSFFRFIRNYTPELGIFLSVLTFMTIVSFFELRYIGLSNPATIAASLSLSVGLASKQFKSQE
jgi:O-antigen ligase